MYLGIDNWGWRLVNSDEDNIAELKGYKFDLTDSKDAYKYDETLKKVGEYAGRMYGNNMKNLIVHGKELVLKEPKYPSGESPSDKG